MSLELLFRPWLFLAISSNHKVHPLLSILSFLLHSHRLEMTILSWIALRISEEEDIIFLGMTTNLERPENWLLFVVCHCCICIAISTASIVTVEDTGPTARLVDCCHCCDCVSIGTASTVIARATVVMLSLLLPLPVAIVFASISQTLHKSGIEDDIVAVSSATSVVRIAGVEFLLFIVENCTNNK